VTIFPRDIMLSAHQLANLQTLCKRDFFCLYASFREKVETHFPPFSNLYFFTDAEDINDLIPCSATRKTIKKFLKNSGKSLLYKSIGQNIVLSFVAADSSVLAVITGVDFYFSERVSIDWLEECALQCYQDFLVTKQRSTDPETGLLNISTYYSDLEKYLPEPMLAVLLVEVYPRASSAREGQRHNARVVRSLKSCLGSIVPLYYLGHHVFALLTYSPDDQKRISHLGARIITWLKRDGFRKVHVGKRIITVDKESVLEYENGTDISKQAWSALNAARKKGPFGICDYDQLIHPENFPLRRPARSLLAKFRRKWADCDSFSVIQLQPEDGFSAPTLSSLAAKEDVVKDGEDIYILRPGIQPAHALSWINEKLHERKIDNIRVGIAYYPNLSFSKSNTVFQCRKALLHAAFYGRNGKAIFDAVSLNVSGDIYYGEGDLAAAIKEYRAGLQCEPDNINLLNSLGVTYADINRHADAQHCFEKALAIDTDNFMAFYNLGLGAEQRGNVSDAVEYYERANTIPSDFPEATDELRYNLGRLYSIIGRYEEAVEILQVWYSSGADSKNNGRALTYLGKAFFGLEDYDQAMVWLQRALNFDEFDGESMGLLGCVYLLKNEGNDIALSLCERGADLVPDNLTLKLYLSRALISCGRFYDARAVLRICRRRKEVRIEAQMLTCLAYKEEGNVARAKYWVNKFLHNSVDDEKLSNMGQKIREELYGT